MLQPDDPGLSLAIAPLNVDVGEAGDRYAIWVLQAPHPGGYVHHDCSWSDVLTQTWREWQDLFSLNRLPVPTPPQPATVGVSTPTADPFVPAETPPMGSYSSRLMQQLGLELWTWLFAGAVQRSFAQSQGIALGRRMPLRVRLDVRDPALIGLPWEIAQPRLGKPALSLAQNILFSRTTCDVDPLSLRNASRSLQMLLVLGQPNDSRASVLDLETEASEIAELFANCSRQDAVVPYRVDTLIQPTPAELLDRLETKQYNILLYSGHGVPSPEGGRLFLREDTTLTGTELAQVLVRSQVTLAVFNTCWGAGPDRENDRLIPRSSLAEVLVHHGVPAVLAMRDAIADREALSFIQSFAQALAQRQPIDRAVAIARQQLLTLYKFNQPAWTLPVLYLHPEFDGHLLEAPHQIVTELPENSTTRLDRLSTKACLRSLDPDDTVWRIRRGLLRVGRTEDNDAVVPERWVSQRHAEIFYRHLHDCSYPTYFLRDFSRYGTLVREDDDWRKIHHQEISLSSGTQLKFGSSQGQAWEFVVDS
ncbi:CHAT domain-containing protein [Baaleninema simplex]|uniref:CHAT domain-containing protein n=1 Tax=Baaleninema simplex TaxID=2862350 RepID=UPI0003460653|nr:CHAT domain-containing protein [Baaleninema simplex]